MDSSLLSRAEYSPQFEAGMQVILILGVPIFRSFMITFAVIATNQLLIHGVTGDEYTNL